MIRAAIGPTSATEVVAYFAGYNELAWILEPAEQELLFRLSAAAFDNDQAWWGQSLAIAANQRGESARAAAYADSALSVSASQLAGNSIDPQLHVLYGVALALAGRNADALREGAQGVALVTKDSDPNAYYIRLQMVRIQLIVGMKEQALDGLEALARKQYIITPGRLRLDPTYASLKGHPRFEKLLVQPTSP